MGTKFVLASPRAGERCHKVTERGRIPRVRYAGRGLRVVNFSLCGQREVAREMPLRRGRFRFLPLLRTSLFETTQGGPAGPPWILPGERWRDCTKSLPSARCGLVRASFSLAGVGAKASSEMQRGRIVAGIYVRPCEHVARTQRPFLSYTGRDAVFLFGKTKRKIGGGEPAAAGGRRRQAFRSAAAPLAGRSEAGLGKALRQGALRRKRSACRTRRCTMTAYYPVHNSITTSCQGWRCTSVLFISSVSRLFSTIARTGPGSAMSCAVPWKLPATSSVLSPRRK